MGLALQGLYLLNQLAIHLQQVLVLQAMALPLEDYSVVLLREGFAILLESLLGLCYSSLCLLTLAAEAGL